MTIIVIQKLKNASLTLSAKDKKEWVCIIIISKAQTLDDRLLTNFCKSSSSIFA